MYSYEISEYTNRRKMKQTAARVYARLHQIKTILCKTGQSMSLPTHTSISLTNSDSIVEISSGTNKTSNQQDNSAKICHDNKQSKSTSPSPLTHVGFIMKFIEHY